MLTSIKIWPCSVLEDKIGQFIRQQNWSIFCMTHDGILLSDYMIDKIG